MRPQPRLFVFNDPHPMRIDGALAAEIGLEESIALLQLEYLISISTAPEHEGRRWTYQSLQELHDNHFPWWSVTTISRIVKSLERKGLIIVANFNKKGYDRTRWYAVNPEGINKLHSIAIYQNGKSILQNEKSILQSGDFQPAKVKNPTRQIETPIPETSTETSTEREERAEASDDPFEALINSPDPFEQKHGRLDADSPLPEAPQVAAPRTPQAGPLATALAEVCGINLALAPKGQRARLKEAAAALHTISATPEQVQHFGQWFARNDWRGRDKGELPTPELVRSEWEKAMKSFRPLAQAGGVPDDETPEEQQARFTRVYEKYFKDRQIVHPSTYRVANSGD